MPGRSQKMPWSEKSMSSNEADPLSSHLWPTSSLYTSWSTMTNRPFLRLLSRTMRGDSLNRAARNFFRLSQPPYYPGCGSFYYLFGVVLNCLRHGCSRRDTVDIYSQWPYFSGQRPGKSDYPRLGRTVLGIARDPVDSRRRGYINNLTTFSLYHMIYDCPATVSCPVKITLDDEIPEVLRLLVEFRRPFPGASSGIVNGSADIT